METATLEWNDLGVLETERPSEQFLRAVADLLETDADDLLSEMGYVHTDAVVREQAAAAA